MTVSAAAPPAPLTVALPEDPSARLAFSRRAPESPAGQGGPERDAAGSGSVSLLVGVDPGHPDAPLVARARLAAALGLEPGDMVYPQQPHGPGVAVVGPGDRGRGAREQAGVVPGVDALVTTATGVGLAVLAADCVPVLLVDPGRAVGAAHAGRRGLTTGVVPATLEAMTSATAPQGGGDVGTIVAVVGPAIGGCCYELPEALADEVAADHPEARATTTWGTPSIDVGVGVAAQLRAAGVARVERVEVCTACGGYDWFSARADASTRLRRSVSSGRHAGAICRSTTPLNPGFTSTRQR